MLLPRPILLQRSWLLAINAGQQARSRRNSWALQLPCHSQREPPLLTSTASPLRTATRKALSVTYAL